MNPSHTRSDERICLLAALALATSIVYGSLVPFDLRGSEAFNLRGWLAQLQFTPWSHVSPADLLVNIAVGVPLGFVLMGALRAGGRSAVGAALAVVVSGCISAVLGVVVELLQVLSPTRQGSWNDVLAQALGAAGGALVWTVAGRAVIQWLRDAANERASCGYAARLLHLYVPIYLLVQLTPFDSGRAAELATKYKDGRDALMPFTHPADSTFVGLHNLAGNALLAIPIGALAALGWVRRGTRRTVGWAVLLGVSIVLTVGIAQEVSSRRHTGMSELLVGTLGVTIGVAAGRLLPRPHVRKPIGQSRLLHPWFLVAAGAWTLVLVGYSWYPFDFDLTSEILSGPLTRISVVPFGFYYWYAVYIVNPLEAVHESLLKFVLAVPLGSLLRLAWPVAAEPRIRRRQSVAALGVAIIVLVGIELGQMFVPMRFPDVTDLLIGLIGAAAGSATVTAFASRRSTAAM
jgi:glycopeptide antibiotics resistance protein